MKSKYICSEDRKFVTVTKCKYNIKQYNII